MCSTKLVATAVLLCGLAILPEFALAETGVTLSPINGDGEIKDVLDQKKWGQCPIPKYCLVERGPCGDEVSRHVTVNCSDRDAGPYIPDFTDYFISRRTWSLDFSHNGISKLNAYSFFTANGIAVNLTDLDLSHNFLESIAYNTFTGLVSKDLTRLDLSYNQLKSIPLGTFVEMPSLTTLDISHNRLVSMTAMCRTPFAQLTRLNLAHNSISSVDFRCLSNSEKNVNLWLDNNLIGSMDDCSYSSQVTPAIGSNPIICGCSGKFSSSSCIRWNGRTNTTSKSSQQTCGSSGCVNITFALSYEPVTSAVNKRFNIQVKLANGDKHRVELFEYVGLGGEGDLSADLVEMKPEATNSYSSTSGLSYANNYTVCVTPGTDDEARQRTCRFLHPQYFSSSATRAVLETRLGSALLILLAIFIAY